MAETIAAQPIAFPRNRRPVSKAPLTTTLGVIIGNREFFPDQLVAEAREDVLNLFGECGVRPILISPDDSKLGGIETHVHTCVSIVPTLRIGEFIGQLKGSPSHEANQKMGHKVLDWQTGYGVVSFGTKDLDWVKDYVRNQRARHARGEVVDRLERITAYEDEAKAEPREAR